MTSTSSASSTTAPVTAAASGRWTLGDLPVNRIGFGTMRLPQTGGALVPDAVPRDRDAALAVLRRAVDLGVNHIDTAAFYFSPLRSANELINSALAPYADDLVITTKVGPARGLTGEWADHARTPEALRGQVEENLRQLGRDHLDVVNLRIVGKDSIAERFGALAELRQAGLIRHLGLSNVTPAHLAEAQAIAPVVCVQNRYGIGVRPEDDAFVRDCGEQGIAFVPFYAIAAAGAEGGATGAEPAEILTVARAHGVSPAEIRLAWTLHRGPHVLAIPGTGDLGHLAANVAAGALRLSEDELELLETLHRSAAPTG
ncbi:oxidoreductase [Streptomyces sp. ME02-6991-2A]|uniref:oxidoreductase n=1 Tax=Streptomyces sp. ME02-6991-2A TaxID=3028677 RepID=UPI0029AFD77E|nr:oxidoreductase [Streptomyces sp. ME02-6991-2A]MDX3377460.1 oxidoreductase [Streptomyces sp. ME02-6991-2A]